MERVVFNTEYAEMKKHLFARLAGFGFYARLSL
jgi:hypothetical protein